jgi:hypothetical protein
MFVLAILFSACSGGGSTTMTPPQTTTLPTQNVSQPIALNVSANVSSADRAAVTSAKAGRVQIFPTHVASKASAASTKRPQSVVYPADLTYYGGAVVTSARVYNVFDNSGESNFGSPNDYEMYLSYSNMIHMVDEYVHATGANRYDWAGDIAISYAVYSPLGDNDLIAILHAAAEKIGGGGYGRIYHLFLPNGTDYCSTGTLMASGDCNASSTSPNPSFCGFHGSVTYSDIGETLFTVQPYQDTFYCGIDNTTSDPQQPTPNGLQDDTQYSTLSHETFETITDPDVGQGWYDANSGVNGEMSDLCAYIPQNVNLSGRTYRVQLEYSNAQHGCNNQTP